MTTPIPILARATGFDQQDVCPHCHCPLTTHHFRTGAYINTSHHCARHGDVAPLRIAAPPSGIPDWSAA